MTASKRGHCHFILPQERHSGTPHIVPKLSSRHHLGRSSRRRRPSQTRERPPSLLAAWMHTPGLKSPCLQKHARACMRCKMRVMAWCKNDARWGMRTAKHFYDNFRKVVTWPRSASSTQRSKGKTPSRFRCQQREILSDNKQRDIRRGSAARISELPGGLWCQCNELQTRGVF